MRTVATVVAGLVASGALAVPASARPAATITLPLHGTVILAGSHVRCGSGDVNGQSYVDSGIAGTGNEPKQGGYVVLMTGKGRVTIFDSSTQRTVFSRAAAAVRAVPTAHVGDTIVLPGIAISCNASRVAGKPAILCYHVDGEGQVRRRSVSFGISDAIVTSLGWNQALKVRVLGSWPENG
jgi:hypothetical protein